MHFERCTVIGLGYCCGYCDWTSDFRTKPVSLPTEHVYHALVILGTALFTAFDWYKMHLKSYLAFRRQVQTVVVEPSV